MSSLVDFLPKYSREMNLGFIYIIRGEKKRVTYNNDVVDHVMGKALKKYFPEDVGPEEELSNDGNEPRPKKRTYNEGRIQQYSVNLLKKIYKPRFKARQLYCLT